MPESVEVRAPATGTLLDEVEVTAPDEVQTLVDRARAAQAAWTQRPLEERGAVVDAFQRRVLDHRRELASAVAREAGKPFREALVADVLPTLDMARSLDEHGAEVLEGSTARLENPLLKDRTSRVDRTPVGVVAVIAPWNYPLAIPATQTLTALYAGNAVVLKPSEKTPLVGERLVEHLHAAGVPEDVLGLAQGAGDTGQALVEAGPNKVLFTGSEAVGRKVRRQAAEQGAEATLELGGNDAALVLDDARVDLAARGVAWAAFTNAGQTCAAVERCYVHEAIADDVIDRTAELARNLNLGSPEDPDTDVGPLIDEAAVDRVDAHVQDALDKGASLEAGGSRRESLGACFFEPTVLADVDEASAIMREETFGPVLPIVAVPDASTAVERANDTRYGLTASVWTTRSDRGDELAAKLDAGTVTVNDHAYTYAACETPWGGVKASGNGVTHGRWGLEDVTRIKHVNHARPDRATSPWYFPYDEDLERLADDGLELVYGRKLEGLSALPAAIRRLVGADDRG